VGDRTLLSRALGAAAIVIAGAACGGGGDSTGSGGSGGSGGSSGCEKSEVVGEDGSCVTVGLSKCAARFVDSDGVCRPAMAKCDKGTIPIFTEGCAPVGIPKCASIFVGDDGLCHPTMAKCKSGTFAVPSLGCVPIDGKGCGSGTWGDIEDQAGTLYVDASYAGGGSDGTKAKPYASVADALHTLGSARIAIAAGVYSDFLLAEHDVEIVGRCPSMVTLDGDDQDPVQPVNVGSSGASLTLRNVRLSGDAIGVYAEGGGTVLLDGIFFDGTRTSAVAAFDPTKVTVSNSFISGTRASPTGDFGVAGQATTGASISFVHSALFHNTTGGAIATEAGSAIGLDDTLIEDTLPRPSDLIQGGGVAVQHGASANLKDSAIVTATGVGVQIRGAKVTADGLLIEGTRPQASDMGLGVGVDIDEASTLTITSSALLANRSAAIYANDGNTIVTLDKVLVQGTLAAADTKQYGFGISFGNASKGLLTNVSLVENHEVGLLLSDQGTTATATGMLVEATERQTLDGQFGVGITVVSEANLTLSQSAVIGGAVAGMLVDVATVKGDGCLFSKIAGGDVTLLNPTRHFTGVGDGVLAIESSARVDIGTTRVENCARAGFLFSDAGGSISLSRAEKNVYGLVIDGMVAPTIDKATALADNVHPKVDDASLPVPSAPAPPPR
jgi:hypothetical protein